jgi:hypothetical protein
VSVQFNVSDYLLWERNIAGCVGTRAAIGAAEKNRISCSCWEYHYITWFNKVVFLSELY